MPPESTIIYKQNKTAVGTKAFIIEITENDIDFTKNKKMAHFFANPIITKIYINQFFKANEKKKLSSEGGEYIYAILKDLPSVFWKLVNNLYCKIHNGKNDIVFKAELVGFPYLGNESLINMKAISCIVPSFKFLQEKGTLSFSLNGIDYFGENSLQISPKFEVIKFIVKN